MFNAARLKLTGWYLLIIMVLSLTFSFIIFRFIMAEITRFEQVRLRGLPPIPLQIANPTLYAEIRQRVIYRLGVVNAGILVVSGVLGYLLAGRTLAPIQTMVDEQNRFISDASHELKTPLTSLKIAFEVWLRNKNLKEAEEVVRESIIEVNKLQVLSESLLQLAWYQKTDIRQTLTKVSVQAVVDAALKKLEVVAKKKKINLSSEGRDFQVQANQDQLTNLLVILLDNAIKYSSSGQTVKVTTANHKIKVMDQGMGIAREDLPKIFDRFYRADAARTKTKVGGYGLGLSIAKRIADMHHWGIFVDSKLDRGTTFTIDFGWRGS